VLIALTREVSPALGECELTHLPRVHVDPTVARHQHDDFERRLSEAGCSVRRLPADETMPDSVFVEDMAVVFDELAVIARPGAESRVVETPAVVEALRSHRMLAPIAAPATLDGGDVLVAGRQVFIGRSSRTSEAGVDQMRQLLSGHGYSVRAVRVAGCLHLKSAVTCLGENLLLVNPAWAPAEAFAGFACICVDPSEPSAANALLVGDVVIYPDAYPRTRRRLEARGLDVRVVDVSELAKAEGGVTCCSVIFESGGRKDAT
jgi:dimethylargininase